MISRMVENVVWNVINPIPEYSVIEHVMYRRPDLKLKDVKAAIKDCLDRGTIILTEVGCVGPEYAPGKIPGFTNPVRVMFACMKKTGVGPDGFDTYCHGGDTAIVERSVWEARKLMVSCPRCGRRLCQWEDSLDNQFTDLDPALHNEVRRLAMTRKLSREDSEKLRKLHVKIEGKVDKGPPPPLTPAMRRMMEKVLKELREEEQ